MFVKQLKTLQISTQKPS